MKNRKHNKSWLLGAAAFSLLLCAAAAVYLHVPEAPAAPDAAEPASEPANSLYLNSVKPDSEDSPLLAESNTYVCGAVLYQSPAISSYFADGGSLGYVTWQDNVLTITDGDGETQTFSPAEAQTYSLDEFKQHFSSVLMEGEMEEFSALLPADTKSITHFICQSAGESGQPAAHLWEITSEGSGTQLWMGDISLRLYALINLSETFPFLANGALWTYDPSVSTAIPVRFDLDGPVTVTADRLSSSIAGEQTGQLTVQRGETIYWWPAGDGAVQDGDALEYRLSSETTDHCEKLALHSAMCCEGLYGSKTYGISNNWLGAASSAIHPTALRVDSDTGELVIGHCESFPYATGIHGTHCIRGRHTLPETADAASTGHHHDACGEEHAWKNCF